MVVQDKPNYRDVSQGESGSTDRKQRLRERFEVVKKLGQGTYGKVQLAINKETKQEVAIKTIKKAKIENEQDLVRIRREIQIMSSIRHPHIIHIYEVFENHEKIVLIMQYASGGELYDYLGCRKKLDENEARRVFRQVASAIFYCHKNRICHRDLKLENILLDDRGNAKIADFGLSNVFDERFKLKTFCGSPLYASPEIVMGTPYCGPEVDCWSLGVLLYTLVYGAMPFDGSNFKRLVKQISEGEYFEPREKSGASGLIRRLLTVDINHRATIRDICTDWWVNQGYDHSLLKIAGDLANLTPVRLDLLLALSSASSSQAADQSLKKQTITATGPAESKNMICNGYYSKSHPLYVPESGGNRKRTVTTADECNAHNACATKEVVEKQQTLSVVDSTKEFKGELTNHKKRQENLTLIDAKIMSDKNENNTLIIVQDLIKDVISKVEQQINFSKMELLNSTATKQTQEKLLANNKCKESDINDDVMEYEDVRDKLKERKKSESLHISPEAENRKSLLQQNAETSAIETPQNSKSFRSSNKNAGAIETSKSLCISSDASQTDTDEFPEKPVGIQTNGFGQRKMSIPSKSCNLQSRKDTIKLMEPDVVIPIFNVCCNIPKRSVDSARLPPDDLKLKDTFRFTPSSLTETVSNIDHGTKSNNDALLKCDSKDISSSSNANTDMVSNSHRKDFVSSEIHSQVSTSFKETQENIKHRGTTSESTNSSADVDQKECPSQTEVPKLPPRKRFLVRIPKPGKSNEKDIIPTQSDSDDSNKKLICDKQGNKAFQEESRIPRENKKLDLQMVSKDISVTSFIDDKDKMSSVCSEDDVTLTPNKRTPDVESSPKLSQRKSRRDSSKRCLSFNTKTGMNRESENTITEKQDCRENKTDDSEIKMIISAKEPNVSNKPSNEHNKTEEVLKDANQLPQTQIDQSNDSHLKNEIFSTANDEREYPSLGEKFGKTTPGKLLEKELTNKCVPVGNCNVQEMVTDTRSKYEAHEWQNMEISNFCDLGDISGIVQQWIAEQKQSRPLEKPKQRSLSRTRAMSIEFESLAQMPPRIVGPPKKPPGKVEIPKTFDPNQPITSPKAEMKEIIFIPTACVSENKEKIQKKIEKVKRSAIVIPPRRKSDAGVACRKKKYTRSKTDFILRNDDLDISDGHENLVMDEMQQEIMYQEAILQNGEAPSPENMEGETIPNEMWYSAVSPDTESEECEQRFKAGTFDGFYNENDVNASQNNKQHRHSVDTESGYWTPPEMATGERSVGHTNMRTKDEKIAKKYDNSEKIMLQRAAFKTSKLRMKLSDEGLDMCSLSSSLESGIYSWRQDDSNGKRISPDSDSPLKVLVPLKFAEMTADGSYAPIARSFKKMTFPPEHSSTSELSENCSIGVDVEKNTVTDSAPVGKDNRMPTYQKSKEVDSKPIKPSDSQSSYGSNDISDDVFESCWVEKDDGVPTSKGKYESPEDTVNSSDLNKSKNNDRDKKARKWQRGEPWNSYSTDKESSDNDDDLDLMVDEFHPAVYGTEGLWQFLKSVNQHLSNQLNTASRKISLNPECHRSKSQESKHPDDVISQKRPVTRSLSREEKKRKGGTQLRQFVSEGKLTNADSMDCFEDPYTRFDDTRFSSGYLASGSSLEGSGMLQKDFMCSADSFHNRSDDISIYGTLRRDKYMHSTSALNSPCMTRKKSLQNPYSSGDLLKMYDNAETITDEELSKHSTTTEQNRRLSLYGTLRPRHLSQQGKTQSQILLSTDDGYQLMYNERSKRDTSSETHYGSLGTLRSPVGKASSELNVSVRESRLKDYEKLLLSECDEDALKRPLVSSVAHRNTPSVDSRAKKIGSDKGIRRVSFSSDVKASKSDYHSSLRQNSLNKVREANEELLSSSNYKSNIYDDEPDGGSLLEALKTYGYRGIMSQKLQSNPDKYEPRLSYRLPTECFLSTELNKTDWDNFEYVPLENTLTYQQPIYTPVDPMEYYQFKTLTTGPQTKRSIGEYADLSCDGETVFKDIFRSHRLCEDDVLSKRLHKFQDFNDLHSAYNDQYAGENWDTKITNSTRKKSFDSSAIALNNERRGSGSEKILQHDRERDNKEFGPTDIPEPRALKQTEKPIEILSEKIQALKSRCQRKSLDESRLKKELDDSGILSSETQVCEKAPGLDSDNERLTSYADPVDVLSAQESESSESVSDRIWRKSFYSRFNDASTVRKKKSSFLDSEYLSGHNFLRSTGKFNIDEEGGVEEPWLSTSLKRRNSHHTRSLPRQTIARTSSLDTDAKEYATSSSGYYKQGTRSSDTEYKSSITERRPLNKSRLEKQIVCDKTPRSSTQDGIRNPSNTSKNTDSSDCSVLLQESRENRIAATELSSSSETSKVGLTDVCPTDERGENFVSRLEPVANLSQVVDNIPEIKSHFTTGSSVVCSGDADIAVTEQKNDTTATEDVASAPPSAEFNTRSSENFEKQRTEENPTESISVEADETQKHCDELEADK